MDLIKLGKILAFLGEQTLGNEENGFFKVKKSRSSKGPAFFIKQMLGYQAIAFTFEFSLLLPRAALFL